MKKYLVNFKKKYEDFEKRERALLLGAVLACLYLVWQIFFVSGLKKDQKILVARERIALSSINNTEAEISVLKKLASKDPNNQLKIELDKLNEKLIAIDESLSELSSGLVSANQLPVVLYDLLKNANSVNLLEIKTLPIAEIKLGETPQEGSDELTPDDQSAMNDIKVFKHGVRLRFSGTYSSVYEYLVQVEESSWQFYWEELDYNVTRYPNAQVELQVYTLSPEQGVFNG